ncbi:DUF2971 domain-containing protein [Methylotenera mobilis]|uniref:DUF2971 domain-containing protein n=1 Tax=Methylotenera mobilis (strain JLW8 / ATCC BAA-1282 / DSM 17540) TaxID=583345 RepID=C6WXV4_METML|nr:DUF2971 domain-containing protein [Methylotenera mobilis]ACT48753.1 conserved hypothetical protein [Methylotenera mobilis JLW8]
MKNNKNQTPPRQRYPNFDRLVDEISLLDYRQCRQFLTKKISPKYPRFQYKYMALPAGDSDRRERFLRDIVVGSKLWLSPPTDFNDPFDMTAKVVFDGTTNMLREKFEKLIATQGDLKWKERKKLLDKFMARPRHEWQKISEAAFNSNLQKTGVFSFAGDPRSILMWSHYADNHQGVCLQFEVARHPRIMLEAIPVDYVEDYPVLNWANDTEGQLRDIILAKFKHWDYEKESRIIWQGGAKTSTSFKPEALTRIIFGCRADDRVSNIVNDILNERKKLGMPDVETYKAHKHSSKYELVIKKLS